MRVEGALVVAATAVGVAAGCQGRAMPRPPGPVASALLAMAADLGDPPETVARSWPLLEELALRIDRQRGSGAGADATVDAMNAVVFGERKFQREIVDGDPRFVRLSSVLTDRRGSCVGLGSLYLALAERLGFPLEGVMVPGHFFVRVAASPPAAARNVELLRRGEAMPDDWYREKYGPWPASAPEYFRPLSAAQLEGVHWFNLGNHLRAKGALPAAEKAYQRAVATFPDFAEAHASLGAIRHLVGNLDAAASAYTEAARLRPDLPGLAENVLRLHETRTLKTTQTRRSAP